MKRYSLTINGKLEDTQKYFAVLNPATEKEISQCPSASLEQLNKAVSSAKNAFKKYKFSKIETRRDILYQVSEKIKHNKESLAELLTQEQGKPLNDALEEIDSAIKGIIENAKLDIPVVVLKDDCDTRVEAHYKPRGVMASILPWNYPVHLACGEIARSIITGNTLVLKPSPETPLATLLLGEIIRDVLPQGICNIISGDDDLGKHLVSHPDVVCISFTGSVGTGKAIAQSAGSDLKRVSLELGGNDAAIVLPRADVKKIANELFWAAFSNCGQVCIATKRIYVHSDLKEDLIDALVKIAKTVKVGNGLEESIQIGPLNNARQREIVSELVEDAKVNNATIHIGGHKLYERGYFYAPTIISNVTNGYRIVDEEQFGPVIPIISYDNVDEAIRLANGVNVGLSGSVWGEDTSEAIRVAHQLECGMSKVNCAFGRLSSAPFGGFKHSGIGRHGGQWTIQSLIELQTISIAK
ncbi:MAG: acyl-CoA reductase-like NAD-dependent aldehyde dehydrogenase [Francisellaceae bacterium]|jgi:acyl-CoA reductase-like NAD-dependent aldehyde dehydrogenase